MILYTKGRQAVAEMHVWVALYDMIRHLGADGMSSEEEGIDQSRHRVRMVHLCIWRADIVPHLCLVDRVRIAHSDLFAKQGAKPLPRVRSKVAGRSPAPPKLAKLLYSSTWYRGLDSWAKRKLQACSSSPIVVPDISSLPTLN